MSPFRCSRTIALETGFQNIQLCTTILKVAFPPHVIGPMFLFPLLYFAFQLLEGLLLTLCFRCYRKFKPPAEGKLPVCFCRLGAGWWGQTSTRTFLTIGSFSWNLMLPFSFTEKITCVPDKVNQEEVKTLQGQGNSEPGNQTAWQRQSSGHGNDLRQSHLTLTAGILFVCLSFRTTIDLNPLCRK